MRGGERLEIERQGQGETGVIVFAAGGGAVFVVVVEGEFEAQAALEVEHSFLPPFADDGW